MNINDIPNDVLEEAEGQFSSQEAFETWFKNESFNTDKDGSVWPDVLHKLKQRSQDDD